MRYEVRRYSNAHRFERWAVETYEGPAVRVESVDADGEVWCTSTREAGPFDSLAAAQRWLHERGLVEDQWR